ncbi:MAG TPA: helix-turn-helix domain-containing protein [Daejeonella sp.]|nr:helix-turn-helix domain-containing protein [Daejeonella sp.]
MTTQLNLNKSYFYISTFQQLDSTFLENPDRNLYFEIYWVKDERPLHFVDKDKMKIKGDWMYLVPPFRNYQFKKTGKNGILIAFNKDLLIYEAKEFSLNVFNLFSGQGDFSTIFIDEESSESLTSIFNIIKEEYSQNSDNLLLLRTLLKAFLLKLMGSSKQQLISPDLNEKRIYHFLLLLESHYITEKKVGFYAEKLSLSDKRLNQILKQKIGKTINQILQERLLIEAKHLLFIGKKSIKEISFSLGFQDSSYFSRFFKKMTKLSPEEFRIQTKKEIALN